MASLVLSDSSQLTFDSQHLGFHKFPQKGVWNYLSNHKSVVYPRDQTYHVTKRNRDKTYHATKRTKEKSTRDKTYHVTKRTRDKTYHATKRIT
uniref:Uncharacterized protein n=1 Tax=Timema douglasi TaxID=61478 RepID=A0A7R8ZAH4_TIMDO|nr:unnamed protein product [Timema douglasi]